MTCTRVNYSGQKLAKIKIYSMLRDLEDSLFGRGGGHDQMQENGKGSQRKSEDI